MLKHHTQIHINVRFAMTDFRIRQRGCKESKGVLFICSFAPRHFIIGCNGKLWRLDSSDDKGYRNDWPWMCNTKRLSMVIYWLPYTTMQGGGGSEESIEYICACHVFEKKGRKNYKLIHKGDVTNLSHLLIRLQRWTRRMLQRVRALAVSMALHHRLGDVSGIAELGQDLLSLIIKRATQYK